MLTLKNIAYLNEIGGRGNNEDNIWPRPNTATANDRLFMVCDGVGGSHLGEEASRILSEAFPEYFAQHLEAGKMPDVAFVKSAQAYTRSQMQAFIKQNPAAAQMASTLTFIYIGIKGVMAGWCGDSRIYQVRKGKVVFRSIDHSLAQSLINSGELTEESAKTFSQKNVILRSIDADTKSEIEMELIDDIQDGDYFLLCSDGLLENIDAPELEEILTHDDSKANLTNAFNRYCYGNTKDNYSMYLVELGVDAADIETKTVGLKNIPDINEEPISQTPNKNTEPIAASTNKKISSTALIMIIVAVLLCGGIAFYAINHFGSGATPTTNNANNTTLPTKTEKDNAPTTSTSPEITPTNSSPANVVTTPEKNSTVTSANHTTTITTPVKTTTITTSVHTSTVTTPIKTPTVTNPIHSPTVTTPIKTPTFTTPNHSPTTTTPVKTSTITPPILTPTVKTPDKNKDDINNLNNIINEKPVVNPNNGKIDTSKHKTPPPPQKITPHIN